MTFSMFDTLDAEVSGQEDVPEPSTLYLLVTALGMSGLIAVRQMRGKNCDSVTLIS
jgi:hypothetical protein